MLITLFYIALVNLWVTQIIDAFTNTSYTHTQLFLRIPQSYLWDFSK
jgi:hypothetical protein